MNQYGERSSRYASIVGENRRRSVVNSSGSAPPPGVLTQSDKRMSSVVANNPDYAEMSSEAQDHVDHQNKMPLWQGLKTYPQAAAWSVLLASTIIMEGYDTSLIGSLFAYPIFAQKYGGKSVGGKWQVRTPWQTGLQNGSSVGSMLGLVANGFLCDRLGYQKTMVFALSLMTAFIFVPFFAPNIAVLEVGQCLCGIPWGIFQTLAIAYASEVCPTVLRGYLTTYANICWVIGQILASGGLKGLLSNTTEWSYRIPFALQWLFPLPIMVGVLFALESPWWLVRHGRFDDAMDSVRRLPTQIRRRRQSRQHCLRHAVDERAGKGNHRGHHFLDCFKGIDLRRTEVACITWACQNMCGSAFMGYSTYFYEAAGLADSNAFTFTMIQYVLGLVGALVAWLFMAHFGRRTLYIAGLTILFFLLIIIGGLGFNSSKSADWAVGSLLLVFALCYNFTVGPVCYAIVAEISSTRLRQKTVVLARITYNACSLLNNSLLLPLQLNSLAWNWGVKDGLFC